MRLPTASHRAHNQQTPDPTPHTINTQIQVTLLHKGKLAQAVGYVLVNNVGGSVHHRICSDIKNKTNENDPSTPSLPPALVSPEATPTQYSRILAAALAIKIFRGGSSSLPPPPPGASPRGGHQPIDSLVRAAGSAHPSPPPATSAQKHRLAAAAASLPAPWGRSHWGLQQQQNLYRPLPSPPSASASLSYKRAQ